MPVADPTWADFQQTTSGVSSTNTLTSVSFTPPGGGLFIVLSLGTFQDSHSPTTTFSVTDTFTGTGAWVEASTIQDPGATYTMRASVFLAPIGSAPGSGTITVTRTAGSHDQWFSTEFGYTTGQATNYLGRAASNKFTGTNLPSTLAVDLGAAPLSDSLLVGNLAYGDALASNQVSPPTGWTEQRDTTDAGFAETHETAWKNGAGAQVSTWSIGDTTVGARALANVVELLAANAGGQMGSLVGPGSQGPMAFMWQQQTGNDQIVIAVPDFPPPFPPFDQTVWRM